MFRLLQSYLSLSAIALFLIPQSAAVLAESPSSFGGHSIAQRFITQIPLRQCESPKLWSETLVFSPVVNHQEAMPSVIHNSALSNYPLRSPPGGAPVSTHEISTIFKRVSDTLNQMGFSHRAHLTVTQSSSLNAFARNQNEVVLSRELLRRVTDHSEIAFIVAHECAHLALGHGANGGIAAEVAADSLALKVVIALGLNPCSGSSVLRRLGTPYQLTLVSVRPRLNALYDETFEKCG
jgi:Zn-dependent protease with chaperone function